MAEFDLGLYFRLTNLNLGAERDLKTLKLLVKHHLLAARYQNYDLLVNRKEVDLSPAALLQRVLVENRGGMCYELCELFLHVLKLCGFDARRVPVFNLINGQVYSENLTNNHNVLIVDLGGKKYLIDNTYGFNAVREPLEFSFEQNEERSVGADKYRLECFDDHYKLNLWLKGAWACMYRFKRPLTYMSEEQLTDNIRMFLTSPETILIRDSILKIGIITDDDRIGFQCPFDSRKLKGSSPYTMVRSGKSEKVAYEIMKTTVRKYLNIDFNDEHFVCD